MRFIVDENLPLSLASWLGEQGHEAEHTSALGLNAMPDLDIARYARRTDAVIVTKDSDFLIVSAGGPRVVHMRVGNLSTSRLLAICERVWAEVIAALESGERLVQVGGAA